MSSHDVLHAEPKSHDTGEPKPDAGHDAPAAEPKELTVADIQREMRGAAKKIRGQNDAQRRIQEVRDQIRAENEKLANMEPRPVRSTVMFGVGSVLDNTPKAASWLAKQTDHALAGFQKWSDKVAKDNLKKTLFTIPVLGWVLEKLSGMKVEESEIEKEEKAHKKVEAKDKWKKKEDEFETKLRQRKDKGGNPLSENEIMKIMLEREDRYDRQVADKEEKEKEKHGGGHGDHGGGGHDKPHKPKADHGGGHGGGGHH